MFSIAGHDLFSGTFQSQRVHVAASFKAVEYEWEHWLGQFEGLFKGMYWYSAIVHLETELAGKHTFSWAVDSGHEPSDAELQMSCEWEREAGFAV